MTVPKRPGTLWEQWQGNRTAAARPRGSKNHIMLGSHLPWFYTQLGGLQLPEGDIGSIGWAKVVVAPALTPRLSGFAAQLQTCKGLVASSWAWQVDPTNGTLH